MRIKFEAGTEISMKVGSDGRVEIMGDGYLPDESGQNKDHYAFMVDQAQKRPNQSDYPKGTVFVAEHSDSSDTVYCVWSDPTDGWCCTCPATGRCKHKDRVAGAIQLTFDRLSINKDGDLMTVIRQPDKVKEALKRTFERMYIR